MQKKNDAKSNLLMHCKTHVQRGLEHIDSQMKAMQEAANSETKGSAGDKHETGRAMMHLEKEKLAGQLSVFRKQMELLAMINTKAHSSVQLGSLVDCSLGMIYLSIALGKESVDGDDYLIISPASPIGKLLIGKKAGEKVKFNGNTISIKMIY